MVELCHMSIKPITFLRNTNEIEAELAASKEPIFITKNGYGHLVLLRLDEYERLTKAKPEIDLADKKGLDLSVADDIGFGFVRTKTLSPKMVIGDPQANADEMIRCIASAQDEHVALLVFPELSLTGNTAGDLLINEHMHNAIRKSIKKIVASTKGLSPLIAVGAPIKTEMGLLNCAIIIQNGKILGFVPKESLSESEKRHFAEVSPTIDTLCFGGEEYPFGTNLIFTAKNNGALRVAFEVADETYASETMLAAANEGATVIARLSAPNEIIGGSERRRSLFRSLSDQLNCAYVVAASGKDESTTDYIFAGQNIISENGEILSESALFENGEAVADIDVALIRDSRMANPRFVIQTSHQFLRIPFVAVNHDPESLKRPLRRYPFLPTNPGESRDLVHALSAIRMQAMGLRRRLEAIHQDKVYIGLSGGLDSTLALLVSVEAFKMAGFDLKNIHAITLPAFGTSKRTHDNAVALAGGLGVSFDEINIKESVLAHFRDTKHDPEIRNTAYENAQARMRTMVLMDIANEHGGLMVGTGDLSELCLGWCTYGGDHLSMYAVNGTIPKTLVRYLVESYGELHEEVRAPLFDIAATPISPELLPPNAQGVIDQKTEDIVGPYELNDFIIYHYLKNHYGPRKIYYLMQQVFSEAYPNETLKKWLENFFRRFYQSQFKRSCSADGPQVGPISVSPRGGLVMPSDASANAVLEEIRSL